MKSKSLDVSKAIDRAAGAQREVIGHKDGRYAYGFSDAARDQFRGMGGTGFTGDPDAIGQITRPATDAAKHWHGWGTSLKPSWEPIVVARKPLAGSVAANVQQWGTGAINVDACRVGTDERIQSCASSSIPFAEGDDYESGTGRTYRTGGRWPPNVVLDDVAAQQLNQQSGTTTSRSGGVAGWQDQYVGGKYRPINRTGYDDNGGASRFFPVFRYEPKAPTSERPNANGIMLRLRDDLTPEQVDHVLARLREAGVEVD